MYKIIGADQREYGPVTADEVRAWIAQGRAGPNTKIQPEGSAEWKLLSELPEFSAALASSPAAAGAAGVPAPIPAAGDYDVDIGNLLSRSWELIRREPALTLGATAIVLLISLGLEFIPFVGRFAAFLLHGPLWGGLCWVFLKLIRGQQTEIVDVFAGFRTPFLQLMLCGVLVQVLGAIGLILCIVPGVYLFVVWSFAVPLVIDKQLEFWAAMELSRETVQKGFWQFLGLMIVSLLMIAAGFIAFGIGIFFTAPIVAGMYMYAYEGIFGSLAVPAAVVTQQTPGAPSKG